MRVLLLVLPLLAGCVNIVDLKRAGRPYPEGREQGLVEQVQVLQEDMDLRMTNGTADHFDGVSVWVNRRYVKDGVTLAPGATLVIPLSDLRDQWGEQPYPRAMFRSRQPTPIALVQIERSPDQPLVGLVVVTPRANALR